MNRSRNRLAASKLNPRIFVYRPGAIGDTILTLPALAALRARFPGCELTYAGNAAMLPLLPVEHVISADDSRLLPLFEDPPRPWPGAELQVIFARQPEGLAGIQRDPLDALERNAHMADWLVDAIDPRFRNRTPNLHVKRAAGAPLVIHPGAGNPAKRWGTENFAAVARELAIPVAVVSGPADDGVSLPGQYESWHNLPLPELAQKLVGSGLFVGNDSGISHLAAALGVPIVAIYVSTDPGIWGVRGPRARTVAGQIDVGAVVSECRELLESSA